MVTKSSADNSRYAFSFCILHYSYICISINFIYINKHFYFRHALFASGKDEKSDESLPPNTDSLLKHIQRANYQAIAWNRCLSPQMNLPHPVGRWQIVNGQLEIIWMTRPSAPDSLIECISCKYKTECETSRCSCRKSGLPCTDVCGCSECANGQQDEDSVDSDDM